MKSLPAFYFPTTLICIDDKELVLKGHKNLFKDLFKCICFTDSKNVQGFLKNYESQLDRISFLSKITDFESDNFSLKSALQLDISKIIDLSKNENRHNEITVLLADYYMPGINGLELCQSLADYKFKKVLLTQADNYSTAKNALNSRTIDYFANKTDPIEQIKKTVQDLAISYFCDITYHLSRNLEVGGLSSLTDHVFINHFMAIVKEKNIIEYYLIDNKGSYLLIDNNKKKYILIVHNNSSLDEFIDLIIEYDNFASQVEKLANRKVLPFLGIQKEIRHINLNEIDNYLFNSYSLHGKQLYYLHLLEYKE